MVGFMSIGVNLYLFIIVSENLKPMSIPGYDAPKYPFLDKVTLSSNTIELERATVTWRLKKVLTDNEKTKPTDENRYLSPSFPV
jgi:hypothetical protein